MPLAAIITPGVLTVIPTLETTFELGSVPTLDFQYHTASFSTADPLTGDFVQASDNLLRLALLSAISGSILTITPPQPNTSYTTSFYGPGLDCLQGALTDLNC